MQKIVRHYFNGEFDSSFTALRALDSETISVGDSRDIQKVLGIFYLGQLLDLPSYHSILFAHGITSTNPQNRYNILCKELTNNKLRLIFESILAELLSRKLVELRAKSDSTWSRMEVTAVLDDSIFRQWLDNMTDDDYFKSWFSGQFGRTAYGFKVLTFGVVIDGVFFPLFIDFVKKGAPKDAQHIPTAVKAVEKWGEFVAKLRKLGVLLPTIPLSCDSGYSDKRLEAACATNGLTYISVPKKNHKIIYENTEINLSTFIDTVFLPAEVDHDLSEKDKKKDEKTPFLIRKRCFYKALGKEMTFLFFRLNGSKTVSVIYCNDKNITAKSLRRHWFQRTQIEQFFRLIKHTLKISAAKTTNKDQFELKLFRFVFIGLHTQLFTRFVRKKNKKWRRLGFEQIRRLIIFELNKIDILEDLLKTPFARKEKHKNMKINKLDNSSMIPI